MFIWCTLFDYIWTNVKANIESKLDDVLSPKEASQCPSNSQIHR